MFRPLRIRRWTLLRTSFIGPPADEAWSISPVPVLPGTFPPRSRISQILFLIMLMTLPTACTQQQVWFAPTDDCAEVLATEIGAATRSVHVAIAYFSHETIADALVNAQNRGLDVMVVGEKSENQPGTEEKSAGTNYAMVSRLKLAGVPYRDDGNPSLMHHKFTIIDDAIVFTGSFNYTYNANDNNNENLVRLTSERMALAFEEEFQTLWENGEQ